jgi:hypothetical protein
MHMKMVNHLPPLAAHIKYEFIPSQTKGRSNLLCGVDQFGNHIIMVCLEVGD